MKNNIIIFTTLLISFVSCISCTNPKHSQKQKKGASLLKEELGNSGFSISIPDVYIIEKFEGSDFDNYYFYPKDTLDSISFSGGIYFGFNPSLFSFDSEVKKELEAKSIILGKEVRWTVYKLENEYFMQAITEHTTKDGWELKIHAFGLASNEIRLEEGFHFFETLVYEE